MTHHRRIWAALTISFVAGVTAGCSAPAEAPTAQAKSSPSTQHPAGHPSASAPSGATPHAGQAAYCAPLAAALKVRPADFKVTEEKHMENYGKLLVPAVTAAAAAGKTEVADFLGLVSMQYLDVTKMTSTRAKASYDALGTVAPLISKDCGINMRDYMKQQPPGVLRIG